MGQKLFKVVANGALLATSLYNFRKCKKGFKYARTSFRLYTMLSAITIINLLLQNSALLMIEKVVWVWAYSLGLPLLISDIAASSSVIPDVSPLHLIIPAYIILIYHLSPQSIFSVLLAISHTISVFFLAGSSIVEKNYCGITLSFANLIALFRFQVKGDPQILWALLVSFSNFCSLDFIQ